MNFNLILSLIFLVISFILLIVALVYMIMGENELQVAVLNTCLSFNLLSIVFRLQSKKEK